MTEPALRTENLTKRFGGLTAVDNLNLSIPSGRLHAIIGPNGAGKTTFFNLVSGLLAADKGRVFFKGRDITGLQPH
jgi:branched-chain amino acid transport system ATP-binding protein